MAVRKDAKYITISVLLHAAVLALMVLGGGESSNSGSGKNKNGKGGSNGDVGEILPKYQKVEITVIDKAEKPVRIPKPKKVVKKKVDKKKRGKDGYWGIGIYCSIFNDAVVLYNGRIYQGIRVANPIEGNPAANNGLQRDDIIFMVDNMPISDTNEVKGDGPKSMILAVKRGERVFFLHIERDWIETQKRNSP